MTPRLFINLATFFVALSFNTAQAKPVCGADTDYPDFEAGEVVASCSDRHRSCRATILSDTKKQSLSLRRKTGTEIWEITLGSFVARLDASRGLDYVVDPGDPQHIPAEFLHNVESVGLEWSNMKNKILIEPKLAKIVVKDLLKGQAVLWVYHMSNGDTERPVFSLRGLDEVVAWIACKQRSVPRH